MDLELDLKDTVEWGKRLLVTFNAGKTQLALVTCHENLVQLMLKCMSLCWRRKHFFKMLSFSVFHWGLVSMVGSPTHWLVEGFSKL